MNGQFPVPAGYVPRPKDWPAAPAPAPAAAPTSRAAQAIEQLLEIERKAKAWDALRQNVQTGNQESTATRASLDTYMQELLDGVKL